MNLQKKQKRNKGFYIALGVCLIAVGTAAWTTYSSVTDYTTPKSSSQNEETKTNKNVSGIFITESSSSVSSAAPASSVPVSSALPSSAKPASSVASSTAKPAAAVVNSFAFPVSGKVTKPFSKKPKYSKTLGDYRAHAGTDLSAKNGEAVKSMAQGVVTAVQNNGEFGNTIVIKHGSLEASYCGLDKMLVKEKQTVSQGQQIGTVGTNPLEAADGPHLHLIVKRDGQAIDPMSILK